MIALPEPEPNTDRAVVIYDGHCRFCRSQVERLHLWDSRKRLTFLSLHDERVAQRYPDLSHEELMEQMYVVTADGDRFGGAAAFREIAKRLPRLYLLVPLLYIPFTLPVYQWMYRQVAKRRYQLAGKTCDSGSCELHFGKKSAETRVE